MRTNESSESSVVSSDGTLISSRHHRRQYISLGASERKVKVTGEKQCAQLQARLTAKDKSATCEKCGELMRQEQLDMHRRFECWQRNVTCEQCQAITLPKQKIQAHRIVCQMLNYDELNTLVKKGKFNKQNIKQINGLFFLVKIDRHEMGYIHKKKRSTFCPVS